MLLHQQCQDEREKTDVVWEFYEKIGNNGSSKCGYENERLREIGRRRWKKIFIEKIQNNIKSVCEHIYPPVGGCEQSRKMMA